MTEAHKRRLGAAARHPALAAEVAATWIERARGDGARLPPELRTYAAMSPAVLATLAPHELAAIIDVAQKAVRRNHDQARRRAHALLHDALASLGSAREILDGAGLGHGALADAQELTAAAIEGLASPPDPRWALPDPLRWLTTREGEDLVWYVSDGRGGSVWGYIVGPSFESRWGKEKAQQIQALIRARNLADRPHQSCTPSSYTSGAMNRMSRRGNDSDGAAIAEPGDDR